MSLVSPCCRKMLNSPLLMFQAKALQKKQNCWSWIYNGTVCCCSFFIFAEQDRKIYCSRFWNEGWKWEKSAYGVNKNHFLTMIRASIYSQAFIQISLLHIEIIRIVTGFPCLPFFSFWPRCMCNCVDWLRSIVLSRWPLPPLCRLQESQELCCNVRESYAIVPKLGFTSGYQHRRAW